MAVHTFGAAADVDALRDVPQRLDQREVLAHGYRHGLEGLPGLTFQHIPAGSRSVYKDFTVGADPHAFGLTSRQLAAAPRRNGIETRRYFDPALHRQTAYQKFRPDAGLPVTERLSETLLTLPLYAHRPLDHVRRICDRVADIRHAREAVARALRDER